MNIAVIVPPGEALPGPALFAEALRDAGFGVVTVNLAAGKDPVDPDLLPGIDLAFIQGRTRVPICTWCALSSQGASMASPPLHTMALLDHPLHWRRVLEREGAPVCPWLLLGPGTDVGREPRVSVLGFPLRVSSARPGSGDGIVASDRDELAAAATALANPRGLIVQRCAGGDPAPVFTGVSPEGPLLGTTLDETRAALTLGLARHVEEVLELAGPCLLRMIWESKRLLLEEVCLVEDLSPQGDAYAASGLNYPAFVAGVIAASQPGAG